ncbi:site-2 protease family protein [Streptomyces sp. 4N509B]|uniref:site-2 protease family protein n=1 Tax=Streptomyces sp. 4N509B TaxID=3457413 RepID=UPI003FD3FA69
MKATFTLGRIAGVRVGVHWSVLVIFGLIALGLAAGRLPEGHPGHGWFAYTALGVVTALVFFASLLAHELAHAVVARRNGVGVDDIVLWLLGGATRMRSEAPSPPAELRISAVGPLVSLVLGAFFALLAGALAAVDVSGLLVEAVAWLAAINILLALFNAIPAAPLDGGRLLRAFLWWRTGDRLRATAGASTAGRVLGWVMVALGLWGFVFGAAVGSLWLALIGWFLVVAASEEERQARLRELLGGVSVRETMTPDPTTVPARMTVDRFLSDPTYAYRHTAFPVRRGEPADRDRPPERDGAHPGERVPPGEGGRARPAAVGLVTVERARQVPAEEHRRTTVGEVMLPLAEVRVARPEDALVDLLQKLEPGAEHRVLVVDHERLVGIVSPSDVNRTVRWLSARRGRGGPGPGSGPGSGWPTGHAADTRR